MERNIQKIGIINLLVILVVGAASLFLGGYAHTIAGQIGSYFFGLGLLVAAVSYFQMRLEDSERLEKLEFEELTKTKDAASLFTSTEVETFPAARSREQFERFFVPAFTVLLFLLQAGAAYWAWRWLAKITAAPLQKPTEAMALYGLFALTLFLLGKYSAGIARLEKKRLLRPGASFLLLGSYISFVVAGCIAAVQMGFPRVDLYAGRVLAAILGLAAVETLISLILEIYRPRIKGSEARLLYDSRLIGLLAQPEGLITTVAQALDYQFGFKVSETDFYRFLEKWLPWLVLAQLGVLLLSTCFIFIGPGEEGLLERFGTPRAARNPLQSGLHLKFPWPIDIAHRFRTQEIQSFNIGFEKKEDAHEKETTVVWTVGHYKEETSMMVASREPRAAAATNAVATGQGVPADLLAVGIPVQFQISDVQAWAFNHTDAGKLLEKIATREVIRYLVGVDLFEIMSSGRSKAAEDLQGRIQTRANELKLGVKIIFVGLQDIHPPVKVAAAFEAVNATGQENEAKLRAAEGFASKTVTLARAEAEKKVRESESYAQRKVTSAAAQAAQFTNQIIAFQASPQVFVQRAYLQALARGAASSRKYILGATNTQDVILLNLEDKIRPDFLDIPLPRPNLEF